MILLTILPLISAICVLMLGIFVFLINFRSRINITFAAYSFSVFIWLFSTFMMLFYVKDIKVAIFWDGIVYVGVVFIPVLLYHFYLALTNKKKDFFLYLAYALSVFFLFISRTTLFTSGVYYYSWGAHTKAGVFHHMFLIYFMSYATAWIVLVYKHYKNLKDTEQKRHVKYFLISFFIFYILGPTAFLPAYGIGIYPFTYLIGLIFTVSIFYSIVKHNIFNVKVITTEVVIFFIFILFTIRLILSESQQDWFINGGFFIISIFLGYFLIKSVQKETKNKENIEKLASKLEHTNKELKIIDDRKSEFINIASHQLRTPTTAIKGYASLLLEGDYGYVSKKEREIITRMNSLADQNVKIIADMLNISRIEQNRMKYTFERVPIAQFILDIIHTLKIKAEAKNLSLEYTFDKKLNEGLNSDQKVYANIDKTLLAQVFENVIDNAVKYTSKGSVHIDIKIEGRKLIFKCSDTGIGIDKESMNSLFNKFGRSKNAQDSGIEGTGIGLYIAKEIMTKHKGSITLSSDGEGKGSESIITFETE